MNVLKLSSETSLIQKKDFLREMEKLNPYFLHLQKFVSGEGYSEKEASLNLPKDEILLNNIFKTIKDLRPDKLKYVVVIGIGGSNLGTMAVYDALLKKLPSGEKKPRLIFLDTNNAEALSQTISLIKNEINLSEEIVVNIISKSGGTTEPLVNFEIIYDALLAKFSGNKNALFRQIVVTTDDGSKLSEIASSLGFRMLMMPKKVGGRFSVFSAVGLFPLCLAGIDIKELQRGAKEMIEEGILNNENNPALVGAVILYLHSLSGKNIVNTFIFNPELESFGKWYRQLLGESLGKELNREGEEVRIGITPITSIGSTDLHSMLQLFLGGPNDKFTVFVHSLSNSGVSVPKDIIFKDILPIIAGKEVNEVMRAILSGVQITYQKQKLAYLDLEIKDISAYSLGALLQLKMIETMYLAELFNINAFDQPNVESYKLETKKILEQK